MENKIFYEVKRSRRARRTRLSVYGDGRVVVTSPFSTKQTDIEKFVADKKRWLLEKINFLKRAGSSRAGRVLTRRDYLENKNRALFLVRERVEFYNKIYGFKFNKIFIRNQKTRWGSCSKKGNLSINYKIVFLPKNHQDYIIAHELCHLKEFNHSKKFWALVAKTFPDYPDIKKELRKIGLFYR